MNANDMRDNIMGRIAIALFGEHNNRTDEECVVEIARLRTERDEARALLLEIVKTYAAYRRRGVFPAPAEYSDLVAAISRAESALKGDAK